MSPILLGHPQSQTIREQRRRDQGPARPRAGQSTPRKRTLPWRREGAAESTRSRARHGSRSSPQLLLRRTRASRALGRGGSGFLREFRGDGRKEHVLHCFCARLAMGTRAYPLSRRPCWLHGLRSEHRNSDGSSAQQRAPGGTWHPWERPGSSSQRFFPAALANAMQSVIKAASGNRRNRHGEARFTELTTTPSRGAGRRRLRRSIIDRRRSLLPCATSLILSPVARVSRCKFLRFSRSAGSVQTSSNHSHPRTTQRSRCETTRGTRVQFPQPHYLRKTETS